MFVYNFHIIVSVTPMKMSRPLWVFVVVVELEVVVIVLWRNMILLNYYYIAQINTLALLYSLSRCLK